MSAEGYDYRTRPTGDVVIFHHGKLAKTLNGGDAKAFVKDVDGDDPQAVMAAYAGNDGQMEHPGSQAEAGGGLRNNGAAHGQQVFRRKTG